MLVILSGGFDPIHSGHLDMINHALDIAGDGGTVFVGVNSDDWLIRKKGTFFLPHEERRKIISGISENIVVCSFDDSDNTANDLIRGIRHRYPTSEIIFANGGDRTAGNNIPEESTCAELGVTMMDGVGGRIKTAASSSILKDYAERLRQLNVERRKWGHFEVLETGDKYKVKTLTLYPGEAISVQYHSHRDETWVVIRGEGIGRVLGYQMKLVHGTVVTVPKGAVHVMKNTGKEPLFLVEVQVGEKTDEEDIVRLDKDPFDL